jgi:hypothetical protein
MSQGFCNKITLPLPVTKGGTGVTTSTGSGNTVLSTSPTVTTPNIVGTTAAGNASAGSVGEFVSSNVDFDAPVSVSNNTTTNVTSISLTAGDWDVWGNVGVSATTVPLLYAGISTTSVTFLDNSYLTAIQPLATSTWVSVPVSQIRVNVSSTTTAYLLVFATLTGTGNGSGNLCARRVR